MAEIMSHTLILMNNSLGTRLDDAEFLDKLSACIKGIIFCTYYSKREINYDIQGIRCRQTCGLFSFLPCTLNVSEEI